MTSIGSIRMTLEQVLANCQDSCCHQQHPSTVRAESPGMLCQSQLGGSLCQSFGFPLGGCSVPLLLRTPLPTGLCAGSVHNPEWSLMTPRKDMWPMLVRGQCTLRRSAGYPDNVNRACWKVLTVMGPGGAAPSHGKRDRHLSLARLSQLPHSKPWLWMGTWKSRSSGASHGKSTSHFLRGRVWLAREGCVLGGG